MRTWDRSSPKVTSHLEPADAGLCPASGLRGPAVPGIPAADQGEGGERGEVRAAQHVAQHRLHRRCGPEWSGAGVVRRGGQRPDTRHDPPGALGGAGRGASAPGPAVGSGHAGAAPAAVPGKVPRDGFVSWEGSCYGVHWKWVETTVQVDERQGTVEIWAGDERIAVHPPAQQPKQRFILPGQWSGLPRGDNRPQREAVAVQIPVGEVEQGILNIRGHWVYD